MAGVSFLSALDPGLAQPYYSVVNEKKKDNSLMDSFLKGLISVGSGAATGAATGAINSAMAKDYAQEARGMGLNVPEGQSLSKEGFGAMADLEKQRIANQGKSEFAKMGSYQPLDSVDQVNPDGSSYRRMMFLPNSGGEPTVYKVPIKSSPYPEQKEFGSGISKANNKEVPFRKTIRQQGEEAGRRAVKDATPQGMVPIEPTSEMNKARKEAEIKYKNEVDTLLEDIADKGGYTPEHLKKASDLQLDEATLRRAAEDASFWGKVRNYFQQAVTNSGEGAILQRTGVTQYPSKEKKN